VRTTQESATIKTPAHRAAGAAIAETPAHYNSAPGGPRCLHSATSDLGPRPLWLLKHALPLRGPAPRILAGPERIESGWWDGGDARRDYYVVQTRDGQHAWAYLAPGASDGWMLHGWFA
jgi:protein ImuB